MATIRISRVNEYVNRVRKIKLLIDGVEFNTISNGETKDLEIPVGAHTIQAKIDWCSSNKLTVNISENTTKEIELSSYATNKPLGSFAALYYITFGANKYLNLKEQTTS
jgi:hypothetical protein